MTGNDYAHMLEIARVNFSLDINYQSTMFALAVVNAFHLIVFNFISFGIFNTASNGTGFVCASLFTSLSLIICSESFFSDGESH